MTAIITAEILHGHSVPASLWLNELKEILNRYGQEPKQWEVFRGNSFQLEVNPAEALEAVFLLKATVKQHKNLDIRIAIGVGDKFFSAGKITESNGTAFICSGVCFDQLKKRTLGIQTYDSDVDEKLNLMFLLGTRIFDAWTPVSASFIKAALLNPGMNQAKLAELLNAEQSSISRGLNRGGHDELLRLIAYYKRVMSDL